ncbi:MAG: hypothetical protein H6732_14580 [Alphaproteobacteria bacterium]|nr:hypothetical protein [Alphaproteobacteria bacterium]
MRARARFHLPDGSSVDVGHGDLIGRLWSATVTLDDPRISEAHALVSLRGATLRLLALRGRFAVHGRTVAEVDLVPGLQLTFADGLVVEVGEVEVPASALGLTTDGLAPCILPGTTALVHQPAPGLAPPSHADAVALVWASAEGWRLRPTGGATRSLRVGDAVTLDGRVWRAVDVRVGHGVEPTHVEGSLDGPLRLVARYDTVHLFRPDRVPLVLHGLSARLVSELVTFGVPVPWRVLADELWPDGGSRKQLDMALVRLRARLRAARVRTDLVRTDGSGVVELFLRPGDVVEDQQ